MTAIPDDRVSNDRFPTPADAALALGRAGLEHDFRNLLQCGVNALRLLLNLVRHKQLLTPSANASQGSVRK